MDQNMSIPKIFGRNQDPQNSSLQDCQRGAEGSCPSAQRVEACSPRETNLSAPNQLTDHQQNTRQVNLVPSRSISRNLMMFQYVSRFSIFLDVCTSPRTLQRLQRPHLVLPRRGASAHTARARRKAPLVRPEELGESQQSPANQWLEPNAMFFLPGNMVI